MDDLYPHVIDCFTNESELNELKLVSKLFQSLCQSKIRSLSLRNRYSKIHDGLFVNESNFSSFVNDTKIASEFDWMFLHDMGIWIKIRIIESKIVMFFAPGLLDYCYCKQRYIQCDPGFEIHDKVDFSDAFYWNRETRIGSFFMKFKQLGNDTYHLIMDLSKCESPSTKLRKCVNIEGSCECKEPLFIRFQTISSNFVLCPRTASVAPSPMISLIDALDTTFEIYVHWNKVWISDEKNHSSSSPDEAGYGITSLNGGLRCLGSFGSKNRFLLIWQTDGFFMIHDLLMHEKSNFVQIKDCDRKFTPSFTWDNDDRKLTLIYDTQKIHYEYRKSEETKLALDFWTGELLRHERLIKYISSEQHSDPVLKRSTFIFDPMMGENIQFVHPSSHFDGLNQ